MILFTPRPGGVTVSTFRDTGEAAADQPRIFPCPIAVPMGPYLKAVR